MSDSGLGHEFWLNGRKRGHTGVEASSHYIRIIIHFSRKTEGDCVTTNSNPATSLTQELSPPSRLKHLDGS